MQMRNFIIDTDDLSFEELDELIKRLKKARERRGEARARYQNLCAMVQNMRDDHFTFCSRHTGEVLNPKDWVVYDDLNHNIAYSEESGES